MFVVELQMLMESLRCCMDRKVIPGVMRDGRRSGWGERSELLGKWLGGSVGPASSGSRAGDGGLYVRKS